MREVSLTKSKGKKVAYGLIFITLILLQSFGGYSLEKPQQKDLDAAGAPGRAALLSQWQLRLVRAGGPGP